MATIFTCECGKRLRSSGHGQKVRCPGCGKIFATAHGDGRQQPPVPAAKKERPRASFLARAVAWGIPLVACAGLVIAIAAIPDLRRIVFFQKSEEAGEAATVDLRQDRKDTPLAETSPATVTNPEPEILPASAATKPGRTLPKMLLVGDNPDFFPSLESAIQVAIPGDVIEIRTNGPLQIRKPVTFKAERPRKSDRLLIRAGKGHVPVLRSGDTATVTLRNAHVVLSGLHFADQQGAPNLFTVFGSKVEVSDCSFTLCNAGLIAVPQDVEAIKRIPRDGPSSIICERCYIRGEAARLVWCNAPSASFEFRDCLIVLGTAWLSWPSLLDFQPAPVELPRVAPRKLILKNNTIICGGNLVSQGILSKGQAAHGKNSYELERNIIASFYVLRHPGQPPKDFAPYVGSHYTWRGTQNVLFSGYDMLGLVGDPAGWPPVNRIDTLEQWNAVWAPQGSVAETQSVFLGKTKTPFVANIIDPKTSLFAVAAWQQPPTSFVTNAFPIGIATGCDLSRIPPAPAATLEPYNLTTLPSTKHFHIEGKFAATDPTDTGPKGNWQYKSFSVDLTARTKYTIVMETFHRGFRRGSLPYFRLLDDKETLLAELDGAPDAPPGRFNFDMVRLRTWTPFDFTPKRNGTYRLIIASDHPATTAFTLTVLR